MIDVVEFPGRLAVQQRVLPAYRKPFFDGLAGRCTGGLEVFAGQPRPGESIHPTAKLEGARLVPAQNHHLLGGPLYLCWQPNLLRWLRRWDPHALILEANPRYPMNWRAQRWMRSAGRPVLGWGLGVRAPGPLRWLWRAYLRAFDAVLAYSAQGAEEYRGLGMPADRVFTVGNAVKGPPTKQPDRDPPVNRPLRILFVGRLQERKRVDLLLQAAAEVKPVPEVWIVGDGPARPELERLAAKTVPDARFTGALHGEDLQETFLQADLFVLPGTGGLAVQEAMYYGLPAIVAQGDGTQRDLISPENGWLIPAGDLNALVDALQQAADQPRKLARMGNRSFDIAREAANIETMQEAFVNALLEVGEFD